jgi:hypothetical protein
VGRYQHFKRNFLFLALGWKTKPQKGKWCGYGGLRFRTRPLGKRIGTSGCQEEENEDGLLPMFHIINSMNKNMDIFLKKCNKDICLKINRTCIFSCLITKILAKVTIWTANRSV